MCHGERLDGVRHICCGVDLIPAAPATQPLYFSIIPPAGLALAAGLLYVLHAALLAGGFFSFPICAEDSHSCPGDFRLGVRSFVFIISSYMRSE